MVNEDLLSQYNYDEFVPEKFSRWMNFEASPSIGKPALDFPLWDLEKNPTSLKAIWSTNLLTVVEFGSFT